LLCERLILKLYSAK